MSPLALLAIGFASGIALREVLALPWWWCATACVLSSVLLVATWRRRIIGLPSLLAALSLGTLAAAGARPVAPAGLLDGRAWEITARVVEPPEGALGSWHLVVELEAVARQGQSRRAGGRVRVSLPGEPVEPLVVGDRVRLRSRLLAPHGFHEPDSPDPERRMAARGVIAVTGVPHAAALARVTDAAMQQTGPPAGPAGTPPSLWGRGAAAVGRLRLRLLALVAAHLEGEQRALVESLVLGERGRIGPDLDEAFRRAGVTHVLSVSGLHLAIAGFLAFVVLRLALLRVTWLARRVAVRRIAAVAAMPATGLYTLLTGAAVATVRSCVASWLVLAGVAVSRPATAESALALGALVLLGASPLSLYDPSLQLSFAAAVGTVLLGGPVARLVIEGRLEGEGPGWRIARGAVRLVAASAAALLATAPITAWHFAQAAPAGLVANLVVVPLAEVWVLPVGLSACLVAGWPRFAGPLLQLAGWGAAAMAAAARLFAAHAPEGRVPAPTWLEALLFYAALAALVIRLRSHRRIAGRVAVALAVALAGAIAMRVVAPRVWPSLRVTFLDVGQGDACLVELPDGRRLLVDGGGSFDSRFDPGAHVILPWLRRRGIERLDVVALTHPHPDHANGLASLVEALPVGEVWTNGAPSSLPALVRLEAAARARGVPVVRPHALAGAASVDVLHPIEDGAVHVPPSFSENDGSIVLRVEYAGRSVLLTGDIERRAEWRLVGSGRALRADVLKAGHHCSRTSSTAPFLDAVAPRLVVCSVGAGNRWGFPSPEVVARLRDRGAEILRTDLDGAVTVEVSRGGALSVATARRR